jgi:hypothetical protein
MTESSSAIVKIISIPATSLELKFETPPETSLKLNKRTFKSIHNAWTENAGIDKTGAVWLPMSNLHTVLRTKKHIAKYMAENRISPEAKTVEDGRIYIKGTAIISLIDDAIQQASDQKKEHYARYSESMYRAIRDHDKSKIKRVEWNERLGNFRSSLKRTRIAKHSIGADELTGEALHEKESHFSHIRSVRVYKELADKVWNGLVVNKKTHKIITQNDVNDEKELLNVCRENGWQTGWYEDFLQYLQEN